TLAEATALATEPETEFYADILIDEAEASAETRQSGGRGRMAEPTAPSCCCRGRAHIPGFAEHMVRLRPSSRPENPWLREWFEEECDCTYGGRGGGGAGLRDNRGGVQRAVFRCGIEPGFVWRESQMRSPLGCSANSQGFTELPSLHFVSDAVHAFAQAVKSIQASVLPRPLTAQLVTGDLLMSHLRNVSFTTGWVARASPPSLQVSGSSIQSVRMATADLSKELHTERLVVGDQLASVISSFPESRCANDCESDEAKQFPTSSCCWICIKCGRYDIVGSASAPELSDARGERASRSRSRSRLSFAASGRQFCQTCPNGSMQPDPERRRCLELPLAWSGYSHPHTVPVAVISALGLATTGAFGLVFLSKRDTAGIIKASDICGATGRDFLSYLCPYLMLLKPHLMVLRADPLCPRPLLHRVLRGHPPGARPTALPASSSSPSAHEVHQPDFAGWYIIGSMVVAELLILAVPASSLTRTPARGVRESHEVGALECSGVRAAHLSTGISFPHRAAVAGHPLRLQDPQGPGRLQRKAACWPFVNYANCTVLSATAVLLGLFLPRIYIVIAAAGEEHEGGHHVPGKVAGNAQQCKYTRRLRFRNSLTQNPINYSASLMRNLLHPSNPSSGSIATTLASTVGPTIPSIFRTLSALPQRLRPFRDVEKQTAAGSSAARISDPGSRPADRADRAAGSRAATAAECTETVFSDAGTSTSMQLRRQGSRRRRPWDVGRDKKEQSRQRTGGRRRRQILFRVTGVAPQWDLRPVHGTTV
uniref:G_PROTEIN_RECEP_F3_4 domain-containing protein n=1 Tax=Macrostomum lignano TaxID=282301 RepID=A0A1I8FID6_9PLAT